MRPHPPAPSVTEQIAEATLELEKLKDQGAQAKADLVEARMDLESLHKEVEAAENRLETLDAGDLVEADEKLVLSNLRARADADTCAETLKQVSRSTGFDALTALPNRELFLDRFTQAIANAKRKHSQLALLFVDLNNFKTVNDTLGTPSATMSSNRRHTA